VERAWAKLIPELEALDIDTSSSIIATTMDAEASVTDDVASMSLNPNPNPELNPEPAAGRDDDELVAV